MRETLKTLIAILVLFTLGSQAILILTRKEDYDIDLRGEYLSSVGDAPNDVHINPSVSSVDQETNFYVDVDCHGGPMKSWEFNMSFNNSLVGLTSIEFGNIFDGYNQFNGTSIASNSSGLVVIYSLILGAGNVSREGRLARLNFRSLSTDGTADFTFNSVGITNETHYLGLTAYNDSVTVNATDYTITGNTVFIDDATKYVAVSPHTTYGDGYVTINFTSRADNRPVDLVLGFPDDKVVPTDFEQWTNSTVLHDVRTIRWDQTYEQKIWNNVTKMEDLGIANYGNYVVSYGNSNNTLLKKIWLTTENNDGTVFNRSYVVAYDLEVVPPTTTLRVMANQSYANYSTDRVYRFDWVDLDHKRHPFDNGTYSHGGMKYWYVVKNITFLTLEGNKIRTWLRTPSGFNRLDGKYWAGFKLSVDTIPEAIELDRFHMIDPWYNTTNTFGYNTLGPLTWNIQNTLSGTEFEYKGPTGGLATNITVHTKGWSAGSPLACALYSWYPGLGGDAEHHPRLLACSEASTAGGADGWHTFELREAYPLTNGVKYLLMAVSNLNMNVGRNNGPGNHLVQRPALQMEEPWDDEITGWGTNASGFNISIYCSYFVPDETAAAPDTWYNDDWNFAQKITIPPIFVEETLSNYPAMIQINSSTGLQKAQADGDDILFADNDGNKLYHEIEYFDQSDGDLTAWVNISTLSSTSPNVFWMYYNNSGASNQEDADNTWSTDFIAVYHMMDTFVSGANTLTDSSGNARHGDGNGGEHGPNPVREKNERGYYMNFSYTNDTYTLPATVYNTPFTFECWAETYNESKWWNNDIPLGRYYVGDTIRGTTSGPNGSEGDRYFEGKMLGRIRIDGSYIDAGYWTWGKRNQWNYGSYSLDTSNTTEAFYAGKGEFNHYPSRTSLAAYGNVLNWNAYEWAIGDSTDWKGDTTTCVYDFNGSVDEVRFMKTAVSPAWQNTTFRNMYKPTTFIVLGTEVAAADMDFVQNASGFFTFTNDGDDDWYNTDWTRRRLITVDQTHINDTLQNFPVLVKTTGDTSLNTFAQADGDDIMFVSFYDNNTVLDHEIENYTTGSLVAWVEVPLLSSTNDTKFWMYYGNASATSMENVPGTWDAHYVSVYHFGSDGDYNDSKYIYNGTNFGMTSASGVLGSGIQNSDTTDCWVNVTSYENMTPHGEFTIESWVNFDNNDESYPYVIIKGEDYNDADMGYYFRPNNGDEVRIISDDGYYLTGGDLPGDYGVAGCVGFWTYVYAKVSDDNHLDTWLTRYNKTQLHYVTGVNRLFTNNHNTLHIGNKGAGGNSFDARIDEVRISKTYRSGSWMDFNYEMIANYSNVITMGAEEHTGVWTQNTRGWFNFSAPDSPWTDSANYNNYRSIFVESDYIDTQLTNFPLLVVLDNSTGDYDFHNGGADIAFVNLANNTQFFHEVEAFNNSGETYCWVNISETMYPSTDYQFLVYYNNSDATGVHYNRWHVWSDHFVAVWHMNSTNDSSANWNNGTNFGTNESNEGKIDGVRHLYESRINVPDSNSLDVTNATWEFWINPDDFPENFAYVLEKHGYAFDKDAYGIYFKNASGLYSIRWELFGVDETWRTYPGNGVELQVGSQWHHFTVTYTNASPSVSFYHNGTWYDTDPVVAGINTTDYSMDIGYQYPGGSDYPLDGKLDEIRISDVVRNASWIKANFHSTNRTTGFLSIGGEMNIRWTTEDHGWFTFQNELNFTQNDLGWFNFSNISSGFDKTGYQHYRSIFVDKDFIETEHTNFPLLVVLDNSTGDYNFHNGYDIEFVSLNNITQFNHEVESFDNAGLTYCWVNISETMMPGSDYQFLVYYNNPSATVLEYNPKYVWHSDYRFVHHLETGDYTNLNDSSIWGNDMSADSDTDYHGGGNFYNQTGKIYQGITSIKDGDPANGVDAWIRASDDPSLRFPHNISIQYWVKPINWTSSYSFTPMEKFGGTNDAQFRYYMDGTWASERINVYATVGGVWTAPGYNTPPLDLGAWYHTTWTYNSTTGGTIHLNGTSTGLDSSVLGELAPAIGHNVVIGVGNISMDEIRISSAVWNNSYINLSFHTQNQSTGLVSFSGPIVIGWKRNTMGWFTFSNEMNYSRSKAGWFTFWNNKNYSQSKRGHFLFNNNQNFTQSKLGFFTFLHNQNYSRNTRGWFSFFNDKNFTRNETGWFSFAHNINFTQNVSGWFRFANDTNWTQDTLGFFNFSNATTDFDDDSFRNYRSIFINSSYIDTRLDNFPVLVVLDNSTGDYVFHNGFDIAFVPLTNDTQFNHEIEEFNNAGNTYCWVNISETITPGTDYQFLVYYNDPTATGLHHNRRYVWDEHYVVVYHMQNHSTTMVEDSSRYVISPNKTAMNNPLERLGISGQAQNFSGGTSRLYTTRDPIFNITGALTINFWVNYTNLIGDDAGFVSKNHDNSKWFASTGNKVYEIGILNTKFYWQIGNGSAYSKLEHENFSPLYDDGAWHNIVCSWDGTTNANGMKLYVDYDDLNVVATAGINSIQTFNSNLGVGGQSNGNWGYNGSMEEVRVSNMERNASWTKAEYHMMNQTPGFVSFGPPLANGWKQELRGFFTFHNDMNYSANLTGFFTFRNDGNYSRNLSGFFTFYHNQNFAREEFGWFRFQNYLNYTQNTQGWFRFSNDYNWSHEITAGWFNWSNSTGLNVWFTYSITGSSVSCTGHYVGLLEEYAWNITSTATGSTSGTTGWITYTPGDDITKIYSSALPDELEITFVGRNHERHDLQMKYIVIDTVPPQEEPDEPPFVPGDKIPPVAPSDYDIDIGGVKVDLRILALFITFALFMVFVSRKGKSGKKRVWLKNDLNIEYEEK